MAICEHTIVPGHVSSGGGTRASDEQVLVLSASRVSARVKL